MKLGYDVCAITTRLHWLATEVYWHVGLRYLRFTPIHCSLLNLRCWVWELERTLGFTEFCSPIWQMGMRGPRKGLPKPQTNREPGKSTRAFRVPGMLTRPYYWLGRAWPYCLNHRPWNLKGSPQRSTTWSSMVWPGLDTGWSSSVQGAHCSQDSSLQHLDPPPGYSRVKERAWKWPSCLLPTPDWSEPNHLTPPTARAPEPWRLMGEGDRTRQTLLLYKHHLTSPPHQHCKGSSTMLTQGNSVNCPRFTLLLDGASGLKSVFQRPPKLQFLCFTKL